jgi:hypothetical protein
MPSNARASSLPVEEVGGRQREARHPGKVALRRHVEQPHDAVRLRKRQRPQQHAFRMLKIAVLTPIPSASVTTTTA